MHRIAAASVFSVYSRENTTRTLGCSLSSPVTHASTKVHRSETV
jgi:hypothetical protein